MTNRISGRASMYAGALGKKRGSVQFANKRLNFEGYHLFSVCEKDRSLFVEAVTAPLSWWRRLWRSDVEFRDGDAAVVARCREGSFFLLVGGREVKFEEDGERGLLSSPYAVVHCAGLTSECEFETSPESIHGVVAVAVHQLYLNLLRAG